MLLLLSLLCTVLLLSLTPCSSKQSTCEQISEVDIWTFSFASDRQYD